jgi:4-hydroxy-tetrahydrodipicolinate reductase
MESIKKVFVIGSGKLADAILSSGSSFHFCEVIKWEAKNQALQEKVIIVHAGSGRQLPECIAFCGKTESIMIELSTGLATETMDPNFTLIVCPNTSILVLKLLNIVKLFGHYFESDKISISESHQASKKSVPGTAFSFAKSLNFPVEKIESVRNPSLQKNEIGIPIEYLDKHAYHKIVIEDGLDEVSIETKVLGHQSYVNGVKKVIEAVIKYPLEKKRYSVFELIDKRML